MLDESSLIILSGANLGASNVMSLRELQLDYDRRRAEKSLSEFTKMAWHVIEPGTPYIGNWHLDVISEHLEAVTRGEIRNLLINVPPRHMKSIQVAVM
jgi:hypothetical protein